MRKKSSIIKLSIIGAVTLIALILCFVPIKQLGLNNFKSFAGSIGDKLGMDLNGGYYAVYETSIKENSDDDFETAMNDTLYAIEKTLSSRGFSESIVQRENDDSIRVSVSAASAAQSFLDVLASAEDIRFVFKDSEGNILQTVLTSSEITSASATTYGSDNVVVFTFNSKGEKAFAEATAANVDSVVYIVSVVGEKITDERGITISEGISGGQVSIPMNNATDARNLADKVAISKLSLALTKTDTMQIPASLGGNALTLMIVAAAIGFLLACGLLGFLYRAIGGVGAFSLLVFSLGMVIVLAVFPWVEFSLAAFVGLILSFALAADGIIIISSRIKDEYSKGKSILSACYYGHRKSIKSILEAHIFALLASIAMWAIGAGAVKNLAITLIIGLVLSVLTSLVVMRGLVKYVININQTNPKLFNFTRGEGFEDLSADQNSAAVELAISNRNK